MTNPEALPNARANAAGPGPAGEAPATPDAGDRAASEAEGKAVVRRSFEEVLGGGDLARAAGLFADDYVAHDPSLPPLPPGPGGGSLPARASRTAFPDQRVMVDNLFAGAAGWPCVSRSAAPTWAPCSTSPLPGAGCRPPASPSTASPGAGSLGGGWASTCRGCSPSWACRRGSAARCRSTAPSEPTCARWTTPRRLDPTRRKDDHRCRPWPAPGTVERAAASPAAALPPRALPARRRRSAPLGGRRVCAAPGGRCGRRPVGGLLPEGPPDAAVRAGRLGDRSRR